MQMADRIAEDGFKKAGYEYVCIDVSEKPDPFAITYSLWNLFETLWWIFRALEVLSHGSNIFLPIISDVAFDVYFRIAGHPTIAL